jgi:hypothetical protein
MLNYPKNGDLKKQGADGPGGRNGYEVEVIASDEDWLRKELEVLTAMVSQLGIIFKIKNMDMGQH